MEEITREPQTFLEAVPYFKDIDNCVNYLAKRRWSNGVTCPTCGRTDAPYVPSRRYWQCKTRHPKAQFSIKTGTILEDSPIGLDKWLPVIWQVASCKNGVSSWEIHRAIGVTQKTAWFMLHRVRLAMQDEGTGGKLCGDVEVDETFIGGKARNMHKADKLRKLNGKRGSGDGGNKTVVLGILERRGIVRTAVISDRKKATIKPIVKQNVQAGSELHTDEWSANWYDSDEYAHNVINHLESYVDGNIHTNGMENFWSLLKRGIGGTYVSVEPFHLFRYVDEQAFRYNNRKPMNDAQRFSYLCRKIVGKRLTYKELTGKTEEERF